MIAYPRSLFFETVCGTNNIYRNRFGEDVGYGVYNLISILKNTRVDLSGEDFSELDLSRCIPIILQNTKNINT